MKQRSFFKRKIKIFAVVGIVGLIITGSLFVWAGVSAVSFAASKVNQVVQSPQTQDQLEKLKTEVQSFTRIQALNCWGKAQSLMAVEPWLARPALENLIQLKVACFNNTSNKDSVEGRTL